MQDNIEPKAACKHLWEAKTHWSYLNSIIIIRGISSFNHGLNQQRESLGRAKQNKISSWKIENLIVMYIDLMNLQQLMSEQAEGINLQ